VTKHLRCQACGRKRKKGHEKRVGTKLAYSTDCVRRGVDVSANQRPTGGLSGSPGPDWHATHVTSVPDEKWLHEAHACIGAKELEHIRKNMPTKAPNSPVEHLSEGE
jgi:hypothetical protein